MICLLHEFVTESFFLRGGKNVAMTLSNTDASLSKVTLPSMLHLSVFDQRCSIEQDFFQPQVVQDATIFFLKTVIHDWSNEMSQTILGHLRDAATLSTKLLIMDRMMHRSLCLQGN